MTKEKLKKEAENIVYGMGYDTYESDGHSDFAVRDILIKFAELKTEKILQLERKIASIRGAHSVDCKKLKARTEQVERLKKENSELRKQLAYAKDVVRSLLNTFVYDMAEEDLDVGQIDVRIRAEQFLKEVSE